jgi:hypothetical protein
MREFVEGVVDAVYEKFLDRDSDDEGRTYFADRIGAGSDASAVLSAVVGSAEYLNMLF